MSTEANQRTEIYIKNERFYMERQFRVGEERWQPVTRLSGKSVAELLAKWPLYGKAFLENQSEAISAEELHGKGE